MYRVSSGWPGKIVLRIGTSDDFAVVETKWKLQKEQFTKGRVAWKEETGDLPQFVNDSNPKSG